MYQSINYDVNKLSTKARDHFIKFALQKSYKHFIDELHYGDLARVPSKLNIDQLYATIDLKDINLFFTYRIDSTCSNDHIETGFIVKIDDVEYFLFIRVKVKYLDLFVEKFNLKMIK